MRRLLFAAALSVPIAAQEHPHPSNFRVEFAAGTGQLEHRTDSSALDGDADAALFRMHLEAVSRRGIGGGIQFEGIFTDDELFADSGFNATEAQSASLFAHFTYRASARRFMAPLRFGVRFHHYELDDQVLSESIRYGTIGPHFELAPEFRMVDRREVSWSLYGQLSGGIGFTGIDVDNDGNDYYSASVAFGGEFGTRFRAGPIECGLAFVTRWQSMDDSEPENGLIVLGYDATYYGVLFSFSAVF
jgi:hypothetical protein